ncbi:hypothetical protein IHE44_0012535 [Lamprotornis superbus]|uniref:GRAM domain-containing protein n=1 Tax=Lamprotornis superbus TaxID=245042 RepID=A0A835U1H2_9PASS|nr:hypothetical protein IHE44_0012535 [Lamprotornis superbus]
MAWSKRLVSERELIAAYNECAYICEAHSCCGLVWFSSSHPHALLGLTCLARGHLLHKCISPEMSLEDFSCKHGDKDQIFWLLDSNRHVKVKQKSAVLNMLKKLDKIRFRGHKRDEFLDLAESPNASDTECGDEIPVKIPRTSARDNEELRDPGNSRSWVVWRVAEGTARGTVKAGPGTIIMASGVQDFNRTESDRLNEIKGHLEIALLEKHFLQWGGCLNFDQLKMKSEEPSVLIIKEEEELRKLREETNAETLRQELEKERQRRLELEQRVNEVLKARAEEVPAAQQPAKPQAQANGTDKSSHTVSSRLQKWFGDKFGEYVEDFRFQPEENTVEAEEPLSARRLTENMRRLKRGAKPVTNFMKNLSALLDWYSIYTSAIAFIEHPKEDLTVSEKFQLVLDVAQKAQNLFGKMADILEKFKNLFMWVQPEITQKLYIALWAAFIASCFLPYRILGLALGLYAGIKFFLIDFIFKRCPRLRAKYDTPYIIWISLLTDPQLKERSNATVSRRLQTAASRSYVGTSAPTGISKDEDTSRFHTTKRGNFHEVFNLSENERPLPARFPVTTFSVCENGWRCCLINRDRKMPTDYIRNGVLYVTENYLCFESSKSGSSKRNKVIKLSDITDIQKGKLWVMHTGPSHVCTELGCALPTPSGCLRFPAPRLGQLLCAEQN